MDKLGEGEHDLAKLLVVDVGVHSADHEEQQEGDLVRRVQAVDDEVADPGKIEKKTIFSKVEKVAKLRRKRF